MIVAIAGASGEVGKHLLEFLLQDETVTDVVSLIRSKSLIENQKLNNQQINFNAIDELPIIEIVAVFCCLGTTIKKAGNQDRFKKVDFEYVVNLAKWAKKIGAKQFHVISSMGADSASKVFYSRIKGEMQDAVKQIGIESTFIYQPSLLDSEREELRTGERFGIILFRLLRILFVGPLKKYASIKVSDVAKGMWQRSKNPAKGFYIIPSNTILAT